MNPLHFSITINTPKEKVWDTMLTQRTYREWTSVFSEDSYYEGSWEQGAKILFLDPKGSGMTALIAENKRYQFISIKLLGYVMNGIEDIDSPAIKAWTPAYENYTFDERDGITEIQVDISGMPADLEDFMNMAWPKALAKLKSICE